jgi:hypothetical protein
LRVAVTAQRRTEDQRALTIEYALGPAARAASRTPLVTTAVFAALLMIPLVRRASAQFTGA